MTSTWSAPGISMYFDWTTGNPRRSFDAGLLILSGQIVIYDNTSLDWMALTYRPITRRAAGDPNVAGTTYIDYWGPDPTGTLTTSPWVGAHNTFVDAMGGVVTAGVRYAAILSGFSRDTPVGYEYHLCTVEFTTLLTPAPVGVGVPIRNQPPAIVSGGV